MQRAMVGFRRDDEGDWIAELACRHSQHIRHDPPFWDAAWVEDDEERARRVGQPLDCPLCDRAELPEGLRPARTTATWDASTVPAALRQAHRVAAGTWGLLEVEAGAVRFVADTDPPIDVVITPENPQPIPPELDHHIEPEEGSRFHIVFLIPGSAPNDEGGESACYAHLLADGEGSEDLGPSD